MWKYRSSFYINGNFYHTITVLSLTYKPKIENTLMLNIKFPNKYSIKGEMQELNDFVKHQDESEADQWINLKTELLCWLVDSAMT